MLTEHFWARRLGDDIYSIQSLLRWRHPWKTRALYLALLILLAIVSLFPFNRLLFFSVLCGFGEGFYAKYKWYLPQLFKGGKPPKVDVQILGTKLLCSRKSVLLRIRNLLNSLPNDRDFEASLKYRRNLVSMRRQFLRQDWALVRHGGLWSGALQFKWKMKKWKVADRPSALVLNFRALADQNYHKRYCIISQGRLRLFRGPKGHEDQTIAADGNEELVACGGWISMKGSCLALNISKATVHEATTRRGIPCLHVNECGRKSCASWKLSLVCFDKCIRSSVLAALKLAGCLELHLSEPDVQQANRADRAGTSASATTDRIKMPSDPLNTLTKSNVERGVGDILYST